MGMKSLGVRLMACKRQKKSEPELIVVKILFVLGGAILGLFIGIEVGGRTFYPLEFHRQATLVTAFIGTLIGAIMGWLWANREVWDD